VLGGPEHGNQGGGRRARGSQGNLGVRKVVDRPAGWRLFEVPYVRYFDRTQGTAEKSWAPGLRSTYEIEVTERGIPSGNSVVQLDRDPWCSALRCLLLLSAHMTTADLATSGGKARTNGLTGGDRLSVGRSLSGIAEDTKAELWPWVKECNATSARVRDPAF